MRRTAGSWFKQRSSPPTGFVLQLIIAMFLLIKEKTSVKSEKKIIMQPVSVKLSQQALNSGELLLYLFMHMRAASELIMLAEDKTKPVEQAATSKLNLMSPISKVRL